MGLLGCSAGLLAGLTFMIGLIPSLGWINWFTTLPLATLTAATSFSATREQPANPSHGFGGIPGPDPDRDYAFPALDRRRIHLGPYL